MVVMPSDTRSAKPIDHYLCEPQDVTERIAQIDPVAYDKSRNYLAGSVTWLSPFITHGITNTQEVARGVLQQHSKGSAYRLLYELAWREYFHRTWQQLNNAIFHDIGNTQENVQSDQLPLAIAEAETQIIIIDQCLKDLMLHGTLHNHARMWIAAITCNLSGTHWQEPARWMHYHLLDGDLASNTLSWQWVAGTFSHKRYVANQDNINKYSNTSQANTWLDVGYEQLENFIAPAHLNKRTSPHYDLTLPGTPIHSLKGCVALRSIWQLNPYWQQNTPQQLVFIDTTLTQQWPLSPKRWQFIQHWAKLCNAPIVHGTVDDLKKASANAQIIHEEHPACNHWPGLPQPRPWLYPFPAKPFSSFSQYFKQVKKSLQL